MKSKRTPLKKHSHVTLKAVAQHLGLTPGTISAVLNNSAASRSIPERTRVRILQAARELNYRPNFMARSLRVQRTYTIGVILEEIGDGYGSMTVSGVEEYIREKHSFFSTVAHRHDREGALRGFQHLKQLGYELVAFCRGQPRGSHSEAARSAFSEIGPDLSSG